mmetsp:Transcript_63045/g.124656  ORF Transcript_63045/g.124656 Transcript_63045/m.124656 type:complete len:308 (+) Transcript_63045:1337-2260(+)
MVFDVLHPVLTHEGVGYSHSRGAPSGCSKRIVWASVTRLLWICDNPSARRSALNAAEWTDDRLAQLRILHQEEVTEAVACSLEEPTCVDRVCPRVCSLCEFDGHWLGGILQIFLQLRVCISRLAHLINIARGQVRDAFEDKTNLGAWQAAVADDWRTVGAFEAQLSFLVLFECDLHFRAFVALLVTGKGRAFRHTTGCSRPLHVPGHCRVAINVGPATLPDGLPVAVEHHLGGNAARGADSTVPLPVDDLDLDAAVRELQCGQGSRNATTHHGNPFGSRFRWAHGLNTPAVNSTFLRLAHAFARGAR